MNRSQIVIYKSRKKGILITVCGLFLGLSGGLVLEYAGDALLGWCLVIAAVFAVTLGIGTVSGRKPQVIITEKGITEPYVIREEIEWDAILHVDDFFYRGQDFVRILLDKDYKGATIPSGWFWRLDRMYGQEGVRAVYIKVGNLDVNSRQLVSLISRMAKAAPSERIEYIKDSNFVNDVV